MALEIQIMIDRYGQPLDMLAFDGPTVVHRVVVAGPEESPQLSCVDPLQHPFTDEALTRIALVRDRES